MGTREEHLADGVLVSVSSGGLRLECQTCSAVELVLLERDRFNAVVTTFLTQHPRACA